MTPYTDPALWGKLSARMGCDVSHSANSSARLRPVQPQHELLDDAGVFRWLEAVAVASDGQTKPWIVQYDATEAARQPLDDVLIQERPSRVAVQEEEHRARAFIDIAELAAIHLDILILEWVQILVEPA